MSIGWLGVCKSLCFFLLKAYSGNEVGKLNLIKTASIRQIHKKGVFYGQYLSHGIIPRFSQYPERT
jgi:hypothetical protein